jgi:hypothetical protein
MVFYFDKFIYTLQSSIIHVLMILGVFQTIPQLTARQPVKSPNSETLNNSFPYIAAFHTQQLSLHSQPKPIQTNRP